MYRIYTYFVIFYSCVTCSILTIAPIGVKSREFRLSNTLNFHISPDGWDEQGVRSQNLLNSKEPEFKEVLD